MSHPSWRLAVVWLRSAHRDLGTVLMGALMMLGAGAGIPLFAELDLDPTQLLGTPATVESVDAPPKPIRGRIVGTPPAWLPVEADPESSLTLRFDEGSERPRVELDGPSDKAARAKQQIERWAHAESTRRLDGLGVWADREALGEVEVVRSILNPSPLWYGSIFPAVLGQDF